MPWKFIIFSVFMGLVAGLALMYRAQSLKADLGSSPLATESIKKAHPHPEQLSEAIFAGGCFWCMVKPFHKYDGVYSVVSGYSGGEVKNPTYKQISSGKLKHVEAVQVKYDPKEISYSDLLEIYWRAIDPTDSGGQFNDRGPQYQPVIFYFNDEQKYLAEKSRDQLQASGRFKKKIVVEIRKASEFYPAEDYHQDYYKKNPVRYQSYLTGSGRQGFLEKTWKVKDYKVTSDFSSNSKKPSKEELKEILDPLEYHVTQEGGTERAFQNKYWDNKEPGIYVDVVTGKPLFSSLDKYDSGSGWPAFTKPIDDTLVETKTDTSHGMIRKEVRSKDSDSHLGHVFDDGPGESGERFCINSAALRFVRVDRLEQDGYGQYKKLFEK